MDPAGPTCHTPQKTCADHADRTDSTQANMCEISIIDHTYATQANMCVRARQYSTDPNRKT